MNIGLVVSDPTWHDVPFYRYAGGRSDHRIRVIFTRPDGFDDRSFDPEVGTHVSWKIGLLDGYDWALIHPRSRLRWLLRDIRQHRYDLLVISGYRDPACLLAAVAARVARVPSALRLDSAHFDNASRRKRLIKTALFRVLRVLFDHFFAIGTSTRWFLESVGVPQHRIALFPYMADVEFFRTRSSLSTAEAADERARHRVPDRHTVILGVCKFSARESPWDLIRAFCGNELQHACLLLVGDGEDRAALEAYARRHPEALVVFAGYVPYPQLPVLYRLADVFVHPARREPWGLSVHEALACGLPVIASSRVGSAYDLVVPGKNGFIYQAGDWQELRERLADVQSLRGSTQARAETERVLSKFSYPETWDGIISVARRYARSSVGCRGCDSRGPSGP